MTTRKTYSKEFKLDAIALVVEQKYSRAEAARNLGLSRTFHPKLIHMYNKPCYSKAGECGVIDVSLLSVIRR